MATTGAAGKICAICGEDVSGKPRVKDAQGRYMCAGLCEAKAAEQARARSAPRPKPAPAAAPAAPPVVSSDAGLLGKLIEDSPMLKSAKCESCGSAMVGGAVLCTRCGYNTQTGKNIRTAVIIEKEQKQQQVKPGKYRNKYAGGEVGPPLWKMLAVETVVLSAIACLPLIGAEGFMVSWVMLLGASLLAWIGGTVAAFKNDQTIWGVCGVLMIVPIINIIGGLGFLIFNLFFNEDKYSRALYLSTIIAGFVWGAVIAIAIVSGEKFAIFGHALG